MNLPLILTPKPPAKRAFRLIFLLTKANMQAVSARVGQRYVFADGSSAVKPSECVHVSLMSEHYYFKVSGLLSRVLHVAAL
ncbi:hypothetical protein [Vreelandella sp. H-I2]